MTKTGKEAYRNYQERKKVVKQAIRDHRNLSYRSYYEQIFNFKLYDNDIITLLPITRFNDLNTTITSFNYF